MANSREMQKQQEEALYENKLMQAYLKKGNPKELAAFLVMQELRFQSGMTAEEIDAVTNRAERAFAAQEDAKDA
jgi:hypothetical protein